MEVFETFQIPMFYLQRTHQPRASATCCWINALNNFRENAESLNSFLTPFLVMWFLSAGPPHHLPRPLCLLTSLLLSSPELGWDSLIWKWILLPNCAKHQIRALILWIILFVTLTSAPVPLFLLLLWTVCRHGQCSSYFLLFSIILGGFFALICTYVCDL